MRTGEAGAETMMSTADTPSPGRHLDYEDFVVGETIAFGRTVVTKDDIVRYARAFDPQPFHLSEETARDSNIGRLIASGYHTCCVMMKLAAGDLLGGPHALGSPGVDEVKFLKPVLPEDELAGTCMTVAKRPLKSRPGVGLIHLQLELTNTRGESVMSWDVKAFRRMRDQQPTGDAA